MLEIADFIKKVIVDKEPVEQIKKKVVEFKKEYQKVQYCFENSTKAYEYIKIR